MIRSRTILMLVAAMMLAGGCSRSLTATRVEGSGIVTSETRVLSDVRAVSLATVGDVEVVIGDDESIVIEGEDNLIPLITTDVADGVLTIGIANETSLDLTRPIHFQVTVDRLELAEISGAGTLSIDDPGSDRVELLVPGAGTISVSGAVDQLTASISGTGSVEASRLAADDVIVEVSGAGTATVWAVNSLAVTLSGVGNVSYWGDPQVDQTITGVGDLRALGSR
jgi:Putative auto-transporter adhesin, head GIN domain